MRPSMHAVRTWGETGLGSKRDEKRASQRDELTGAVAGNASRTSRRISRKQNRHLLFFHTARILVHQHSNQQKHLIKYNS